MGFWSTWFGDPFIKHRDRGARYLANGELGLAKAEYESALQAAHGRPEGELAPVREALTAIRKRLAEVHQARAQEFASQGALEEAADALHFCLELLSDDPAAHRIRAELAELEQRRSKQEAAPEEHPPEEQEGDEFLGKSFEERLEIFLGRIEDESLVEQYEGMSEPFLRAVLQLQDGAAVEAVQALEALRAAGEASPLLALELGRALLLAGGRDQAGQAVEELRIWVATHPDDHAATTLLADALRQTEREEEATTLLEQVAAAAPGESGALQHLAEHLLSLGRWEAAAEVAQEALEYRPRATEVKQLLGMALHGLGNNKEAATVLEGVLRERWRINPETEEIEFDRLTGATLVRIYLEDEKLRQHERALDLLRALERNAPPRELPGIFLAQGEALAKLERSDQAGKVLEKARSLAGDQAAVAEQAAQLLAQLRNEPRPTP